jgi:hypothetical protein
VYTILVLDVARWAADTQDRKQEAALEHEAISVGESQSLQRKRSSR